MHEKPSKPATVAAGDKATKLDQEPGAGQSASSNVKPLDGITSIDEKVFLECEILAHAAISKIARKIATEVGAVVEASHLTTVANGSAHAYNSPDTGRPATVILLDNTLISAFQLFSAMELQLAHLEKSFNGIASKPETEKRVQGIAATGAAITAATGAVEGVLGLLGLFRQDTQFYGRTVAVKETALYLEVARALREAGWNVLYPRLLSFQAGEDKRLSQSKPAQLLDRAFKARQGAAERLRPLLEKVPGLEQELDELESQSPHATAELQTTLTTKTQDCQAELVKTRKALDPDLVLFENTDSIWNQLQKGLAIPDEKTGQMPLQLLNRAAESIERFRHSSPAYFLYAEGVVAGGTMRVRRTLWQTLFSGDGLEFSGGSVVSYALFDGKAQVLMSGTHRYMTDFRNFRKEGPEWEGFNSVP